LPNALSYTLLTLCDLDLAFVIVIA